MGTPSTVAERGNKILGVRGAKLPPPPRNIHPFPCGTRVSRGRAVTYEFIAQQSGEYPVRRLCAVLGVPPSSYYAWRRRPASTRQEANDRLTEHIRRAHCESRGTYGSPRVHQWLRQGGIACGRHRVARLMRLNGIVGRQSARRWPRTTQRRAGAPVWPNRLRQDFQAEQPNQKWVADITYIDTREGWLYLAALMDLCSRRVVGWSMGCRRMQGEGLGERVGRSHGAFQRSARSHFPLCPRM